MLDILNGAQGGDDSLTNSKMDVARTFTWLLDPDGDGEMLATFDSTDLELVREWFNAFDENTKPGVKEIHEMLLNHVADANDAIKLTSNDGVAYLLY